MLRIHCWSCSHEMALSSLISSGGPNLESHRQWVGDSARMGLTDKTWQEPLPYWAPTPTEPLGRLWPSPLLFGVEAPRVLEYGPQALGLHRGLLTGVGEGSPKAHNYAERKHGLAVRAQYWCPKLLPLFVRRINADRARAGTRGVNGRSRNETRSPGLCYFAPSIRLHHLVKTTHCLASAATLLHVVAQRWGFWGSHHQPLQSFLHFFF